MYQRRNRPAFVNPFQQQPIQYGNISAGAPQAGPLQPTAAEELTNMVKQKAMTSAVNKGAELASTGAGMAKDAIMSQIAPSAASTAATTGAATGAMGALSTAVPYLGMGLLAGKALGFFSRGGLVGPLSKASYASNGEKITANFYNKG